MKVVAELFQNEDSPVAPTSLNTKQIVNLLELCLRSTYFSFKGEFYRLVDGVALGSPVPSVVANIL